MSRLMERAVFPLFVALQTVPIIAFGAIVVIWFGNTILAKVVIALYLTFFPVTVNTLRGLAGGRAAARRADAQLRRRRAAALPQARPALGAADHHGRPEARHLADAWPAPSSANGSATRSASASCCCRHSISSRSRASGS